MDDCNPGGVVPPAPTMAELIASVVFVPLGYGPAVAARVARLALLTGERTDVSAGDHGHSERGVPGWPTGEPAERLP